jgi:hypothetical protein
MQHALIVRLATFCVGVLLGASLASAASPTVESVVPGVGPRGSPFRVVLTGGHLKNACEVLFYGRGLTCLKLEARSANELVATLEASAGCRPGAYPFRVRTPGGLSELKAVHITRFPVVVEVEPNDDRKGAQAVPLNTTIAGVIDSGDVDSVSVLLEKGQRLSAEVQAIRLGGEMTDTQLAVFGPNGRPVALADDTPWTRQDPFATLVAPVAGAYTIQVRDTSFGGGPGNTYALYVGDFPRPSGVFPPGGQAGKPVRLKLLGLPGGELVEELVLPADAGPWWDYYPTIAGRTAPTPTALRIRSYASVEEPDLAEATSTAAVAPEPRAWPIAFHGAIGGRGDEDGYRILARAGELIAVEAFAARLGSPLDPVLEVSDPSGDLVARNDDDATHDSRVVFRARDEGAYGIKIRDKRGDGGPGFVYRIEVEQPRTSLTLFLAGSVRKSQSGQVVAIPRGNRVIAYMGVRRDGFDGPVRVETGRLPDGVSLDTQEIAAATYLTPIVFDAAPDAPLGASLVELRGSALTPEGTVQGGFQQVVDLIPGSGDSSYQSLTVDKLAVVVTEEAPYHLSIDAPRATLTRDGAIDLVARVERAKAFGEAIEVAFPFLPPGVEMEGPVVVPPGQSEIIVRLFARPDADPASWRLTAEARLAPPRRDRREMTLALMAQLDPTLGAGGRRRRVSVEGLPTVCAPFVPLEVSPAKVLGRLTPSATEQGKTVTVTCSIESDSPLLSKLTATLEGLPPRAKAEPVEVRPGTRRFEFQVSVAPTTPVGEHDSLVCRLDGQVQGRAVVYRVGRGGLLKVNPPGVAPTGADGKPLSPLDALRLKERGAPGARPSVEKSP